MNDKLYFFQTLQALNSCSQLHFFALIKVAKLGNLEQLIKMQEKDSSILYRKNNNDWLPIHYAVFKNKLSILDFILNKCEGTIKDN